MGDSSAARGSHARGGVAAVTTNAQRSVSRDIKRRREREAAALQLSPQLALKLAAVVRRTRQQLDPEVRAWVEVFRWYL